MKHKKV